MRQMPDRLFILIKDNFETMGLMAKRSRVFESAKFRDQNIYTKPVKRK